MNWKTEILERVRRTVKTIDRYSAKEEEALAHGDKDRAKYLSIRGDKLEMWVDGVLDTLEAMGFTIRYDKDCNVESIIGGYTREYRVRYGSGCFIHAVICGNGGEVQAVVDKCKEISDPEYGALGIDDRIVFPNGDVSDWHKIIDF